MKGFRVCPVTAHLWEQVVHDVGSDVMVNFVEDAEVPVNRCQTAPQVAPFLYPRRNKQEHEPGLKRNVD